MRPCGQMIGKNEVADQQIETKAYRPRNQKYSTKYVEKEIASTTECSCANRSLQ